MTRLRVLLILAVVAALGACRSWRPVTAPVDASPSPDLAATARAASGLRGSAVRLIMADGHRVVLQALRVEGDSLVGYQRVGDVRPRSVRRAVPTREIVRVDEGVVSPWRTVLLLAGPVAFGAWFLAVVTRPW